MLSRMTGEAAARTGGALRPALARTRRNGEARVCSVAARAGPTHLDVPQLIAEVRSRADGVLAIEHAGVVRLVGADRVNDDAIGPVAIAQGLAVERVERDGREE